MSAPDRTLRTFAYDCGPGARRTVSWLRVLHTSGAAADTEADDWEDRYTPWADRPGSGRLLAAARHGDRVLVPSLTAVATDIDGLAAAVRAAAARGVGLVVAPAPGAWLPLDEPALRRLAAAAAELRELDRAGHREATRAGLAMARAGGRRYTRHPGYGYRWAGRPGRQRRVADPFERAVIERIAAWRAAGHSCRRIAAHLMEHRVPTADGREWSADRVRRATASPDPGAKTARGPDG